MLIEGQFGMIVVGEAAKNAEALVLAEREQPDVLLLDLNLGEDRSIDILPQLLRVAPQTRILLLTGVSNSAEHLRALALGAVGLVLKEQAAEILVKAIAKVYDGEVWLDRAMMASVLSEVSRKRDVDHHDPHAVNIAALTAREREVIALICEGLQNKAIGQRLHISETTVRHHLTAIFDQLGVTNRLELVIYSYRHNLTKSPRN
jgi:DNA-binding NarL/FixJ family response regulator